MTFGTSRIVKAVFTHARDARVVGMPSTQSIQNIVCSTAGWNQESAIDFLSHDDHLRNDLSYSLSMASSSREEGAPSCLRGHALLNERQKAQLAISKNQLLCI